MGRTATAMEASAGVIRLMSIFDSVWNITYCARVLCFDDALENGFVGRFLQQ
jgi:hypothetical protein